MSKTLHIDFKAWTGDILYCINESKIEEVLITDVYFEFRDSNTSAYCSSEITYILQSKDRTIEAKDKDINTIYFTNKKELIQKLVSQL